MIIDYLNKKYVVPDFYHVSHNKVLFKFGSILDLRKYVKKIIYKTSLY